MAVVTTDKQKVRPGVPLDAEGMREYLKTWEDIEKISLHLWEKRKKDKQK